MIGPFTKITLAILLFLFAAAAAAAQDAPPSQDRIRELIRQLGADEYADREAAQRELLEMAEYAEELLHDALKDPDPEIRERARIILDKMKWYVDSALRAVLDAGTVADLEAFETKATKDRCWILDRAISQGKDRALRFCLKVLTHETEESLLARAERAVALYATARDIAAIERVLEARERFALLKCLGLLCEEAGDLENALKYLLKAHEADKQDYTVNRTLALIYEKTGDWQKVADFYEEMLALAPGGARYLQYYGEALWNLGRSDEALAAWALIVERNANSEAAYLLLADIYAAHGKPELAGKTLMAGLARFEEYRFPLRHAEMLAAAGKKEQALTQLQLARDYAWREYEFAMIDEMVFRLCPSPGEQAQLMAAAAEAAQNLEKAGNRAAAARQYCFAAALARRQMLRDDLLRYLERLAPLLDARSLFELDGIRAETAELYMAAGRWDDTIKLCESVLAVRVDNGMIDRLGECWWRKGDRKKALEVWGRFVSAGNNGLNRLDLYVAALYRHELYAEVVAAEKQYGGIALLPSVLYLKGSAQLKLGLTEDALATFGRLMTVFNNQANAEMVARALIEAGKADEARKFFAAIAASKLDEVISEAMRHAASNEANKAYGWAIREYNLVIALAPDSEAAAKARERLKAIEAKLE